MAMAWVWTLMVFSSIICGAATGRMSSVASAALDGAAAAVELCISMGGAICLWMGLMELMERCGLATKLATLLRPVLRRLFPHAAQEEDTLSALSANMSANLLGLGNAATPMGIQAAKRLADGNAVASGELCRLIVLNTASIQLIPVNVAAIRAQLGAATPFDILPGIWLTSITAAGMGLLWAWFLERIWRS